ncbi:MAG: hypothetical protein [Cressdnaviricota sp.]|nr:MAG: hypothetical protein [Cressdnaviricota sp.]
MNLSATNTSKMSRNPKVLLNLALLLTRWINRGRRNTYGILYKRINELLMILLELCFRWTISRNVQVMLFRQGSLQLHVFQKN